MPALPRRGLCGLPPLRRPQDGENCQGSADEDDWHSWEALVLAGEQLKKDRTHIPEGRLCALLRSPLLLEVQAHAGWGPPGPQHQG